MEPVSEQNASAASVVAAADISEAIVETTTPAATGDGDAAGPTTQLEKAVDDNDTVVVVTGSVQLQQAEDVSATDDTIAKPEGMVM